MGFAGSTAAQPAQTDDANVTVIDSFQGGDGGEIDQTVEVNQENSNTQTGTAASAAFGTAGHDKGSGGGSVAATSAVLQFQDVDQTNTAEIEQNASADGGNVENVDFNASSTAIFDPGL